MPPLSHAQQPTWAATSWQSLWAADRRKTRGGVSGRFTPSALTADRNARPNVFVLTLIASATSTAVIGSCAKRAAMYTAAAASYTEQGNAIRD